MKIIFLTKIICLILVFSAFAVGADKPSIKIIFTRGERSKDSHSEKITIALSGNQLNYNKMIFGSYRNKKRPPAPINKTFTLSDEDVKAINDLIHQKRFHEKGEVIERDVRSPSTYFEWLLVVNSGNKEITNQIIAKRDDAEIKENPLYKNADELMRALFDIFKKYDASISYAGFD